MIKLRNHEPCPITVRDGLGNSLLIPARGSAWAKDEFEWQLPDGVKVIERDPPVLVQSDNTEN